MVKQRMASADVAGEVSCLKSKVVGLRLANIYDLNAKTYVLKLSKSGSDGEKVFLLLESGSRFHTVQVMYDKPDAPSNFTLKLRKHLRTRRLEDVRQLGVDRVVDFVFGLGENAHHLILEMYAQGNVVLTDSSYQVLTLLRSHRDDDKGLSIMAKHPYPMHAIRLRQPLLLNTLKEALAAPGDAIAAAGAAAGGSLDAAANGTAAAAVDGEDTDQLQAAEDADFSTNETATHAPAAAVGTGGKKGKKGSKASGPVLKTIISDLVPYGPAVAEHCCLSAGLQPQHPITQPLTEQQEGELFAAVQQFEAWLASLDQGAVAEGYIAAQPAAGAQQQKGKQQAEPPKPPADQNGTAANSQQQQQQPSREHQDRGAGLVYQDYNPLRIAQLSKAAEVLNFHSFDEALDEFYSKIQGQRVESAKLDAERAALSRLDKICTDQGARATALEREAADSELRATLIEYNLEAVDAAIDAVNAAIATGMDWHDLEVLIKEERRAGNPVAGSIHSLQLDQNKITLLLSNMLDEEEDDEAALTRPATKVAVDLGLTAYSNAAAHHTSKKKQLSKQEKTLAAHTEALKAAEKKAEKQLANLRNNATTAQVVRKAAWFERFHWFISSENYLVISGRDSQQNELIVKRYFRKDDIYVHAELHGASSTIIRNHDPSRPVPPLTLQQAGCACVCRSRAWDSKVVTSAWWVYHSQVSKTAPTGEYLPTGSFMVRGKKQFLPPQGLVMGFGFMFKLEDSCIGRHAGERAIRGGIEDWEQQQQQRGAASDDDQGGASELESTASGVPSAALNSEASSTTALDSFLDMSVDQLAATTRAASSSSTGRHSGTGFERYGLTHPAAAAAAVDGEGLQDVEAEQQGSKLQADSKRYISATERAKLKKAAKPGNTALHQQQLPPLHQQKGKAVGGSTKPPAGTGAAAAGANAVVSVPKVSRGKKGKSAKAKEKYAEQDDEDREMALQVLGSAGVKKTRQDRRQQRKVAREEARQIQSGLTGAAGNQQEAIRKATASQFSDLTAATAADGEQDGSAGSDQDSSSNSEADIEPTQAIGSAAGAEGVAVSIDAAGIADMYADGVTATAGQRADSSNRADSAAAEGEAGKVAAAAAAADSDGNGEALAAAADEVERAEISALLAEENIAEVVYEDGDAAAAALKELDSLTGCPRPDDVLMYAVPVCGPYAALANYKYKVKLTPGTLKKGKAVKQAVEVLVRGQDVLPRERELIRACPEADKINAMVGTVKISAAGLQQIKQASKKAKKAAAQSKAAS